MNAKLCKKLRGLAQSRSIGMPARKLIRIRAGVIAKQGTRQDSILVNDPKSTRGIYRALKRAI